MLDAAIGAGHRRRALILRIELALRQIAAQPVAYAPRNADQLAVGPGCHERCTVGHHLGDLVRLGGDVMVELTIEVRQLFRGHAVAGAVGDFWHFDQLLATRRRSRFDAPIR
jgi:hypothetical protein